MLINELPDDCLLTIFDHLNYLGDLINCYKVCIKWSHLILKRTKRVKYFTEVDYPQMDHCVYYRGEEPIDGTCLSTLFSNLKFAQIFHGLYKKVEYKDIAALVRNQESLEGLIACKSFKHPDKPEIVSCDLFEPSMQHNGFSIKQLCCVYDLASFQRHAHYFPNLERLSMNSESKYYDGPVLEKLKILELYLWSGDGLFIHSFQVMDSCPNLQSAHINLKDRFFVDETIKLQYLQDLVLSTYNYCENSWNDFERLLKKYPNLKHLALRKLWQITDEHIEQLVHILPNLVLLDVCDCNGVTQRAADYVQSHCKRYGRSIKFYFNDNTQIQSDWPQLSTKFERISRGFDFMKHCFLKDLLRLPHLLIPIDY